MRREKIVVKFFMMSIGKSFGQKSFNDENLLIHINFWRYKKGKTSKKEFLIITFSEVNAIFFIFDYLKDNGKSHLQN